MTKFIVTSVWKPHDAQGSGLMPVDSDFRPATSSFNIVENEEGMKLINDETGHAMEAHLTRKSPAGLDYFVRVGVMGHLRVRPDKTAEFYVHGSGKPFLSAYRGYISR